MLWAVYTLGWKYKSNLSFWQLREELVIGWAGGLGESRLSANWKKDYFKNRSHHDEYVNYGTLKSASTHNDKHLCPAWSQHNHSLTHTQTQTHNYPLRAVPLAVILSSILWAERNS